jgi:soluble lytic murein transglycosylase-like protein
MRFAGPGAVFALVLAAPVAAQSVAQSVERWRPEISEASTRFGIPQPWIERVMAIESGGHARVAGHPVTSAAGAMGLMQVMPATWRAMRAELGLGPDPYLPRDNILAGVAYLRHMFDRFGYPGLFGAYNAGPDRYAAFVSAGRSLPAETRAYLAMATGPSNRVRDAHLAWRCRPTLFFALAARPGDAGPDRGGLFVRLAQDSAGGQGASANPMSAGGCG